MTAHKTLLRAALASSFLALLVSAAFGQAVPVPRVVFPPSTVGNITTFGVGTATAANAANFSFGVAANGAVFANTGQSLPTPGGNSIPLNVNGRMSSPDIGRALGRFAAKVITPLAYGQALWDLAKELGFNASNKPNGAPGVDWTIERPGFDIRYDFTVDGGSSWHGDADAACRQYATSQNNPNPPANDVYFVTVHGGSNIPQLKCTGRVEIRNSPDTQYNTTYAVNTLGTRSKQIESSTVLPATTQEFVDAVAAKSGWPTSSAIARAAEMAVKAGESIAVTPQSVTGPATSPGPVTVTNNGTQTTTATTVNNYNYAGPGATVKTTQVTTTVVRNNATGQAVGSPVVTTQTPELPTPRTPGETPEILTCGLPDTPACKIDETGTKPEAGTTLDTSKADIETAKTAAEAAIADAGNINAPEWSFTFQLPTGCAPYVTGIRGVILNVCQFQSTIHGLLSAVWAAATVFCIIGMVGRTIREA